MEDFADRGAGARRRPQWRTIALVAVLLAYLALGLAVVFASPVLSLDSALSDLRLRFRYPEIRTFVDNYMLLGQRGPATLAALPWFVWVCWRDRTSRPLVMLGTALVVLNLSVGIVKVATGRLGPRATGLAHDVFVGGNIFPSGHTSNTVVLYGLIAWLSRRHTRSLIAATAFISVTVGMGTIYLDTHWFSDVVGGWIAGALVLLVLPNLMPTTQRWADRLLAAYRRRRAPRRPAGDLTRRPRLVQSQPRPVQTETPVSTLARSHSFAATPPSLDAADEPTRRGAPRNSPIPSGP